MKPEEDWTRVIRKNLFRQTLQKKLMEQNPRKSGNVQPLRNAQRWEGG